ncbi:hypothetical protein JB92DRAFT_3096919 [Gautieria morchelliformis]|nr:hypothetical protein JB92DRAFT_3096919 [Gautieria morchelliformis]
MDGTCWQPISGFQIHTNLAHCGGYKLLATFSRCFLRRANVAFIFCPCVYAHMRCGVLGLRTDEVTMTRRSHSCQCCIRCRACMSGVRFCPLSLQGGVEALRRQGGGHLRNVSASRNRSREAFDRHACATGDPAICARLLLRDGNRLLFHYISLDLPLALGAQVTENPPSSSGSNK